MRCTRSQQWSMLPKSHCSRNAKLTIKMVRLVTADRGGRRYSTSVAKRRYTLNCLVTYFLNSSANWCRANSGSVRCGGSYEVAVANSLFWTLVATERLADFRTNVSAASVYRNVHKNNSHNAVRHSIISGATWGLGWRYSFNSFSSRKAMLDRLVGQNSVYVHPSVRRMFCNKMKETSAVIRTPYKNQLISFFRHHKWSVWGISINPRLWSETTIPKADFNRFPINHSWKLVSECQNWSTSVTFHYNIFVTYLHQTVIARSHYSNRTYSN